MNDASTSTSRSAESTSSRSEPLGVSATTRSGAVWSLPSAGASVAWRSKRWMCCSFFGTSCVDSHAVADSGTHEAMRSEAMRLAKAMAWSLVVVVRP
ncbi:MAG: hypothetical protein ACO3IB_00045 [Phycisphaerales bacterium]